MARSCSTDAARRFNFAAGPGQLPPELLEQAAADLLDWAGTGLSVLELPFGSIEFRDLMARAEVDLRALLAIPDSHRVLFLQGGAYAHMGLLAMNLLAEGRSADYVLTGHWSERAAAEARRFGTVRVAADGADSGYRAIPPPAEWQLDPEAVYCHITSNETAHGVQFREPPETDAVPLVAGMTSDFLSAPVPVERYGLIYASAQKNAGIAGLTILIIRDDLLRAPARPLPAVFDYARQAEAASRVNTPPIFAVHFAGLLFRWLLDHGGLAEAARASERKSARLYAALDAEPLYQCPVAAEARSRITVRFHLADPARERTFIERAQRRGLCFLAGHPAVGGIRASLYNAMPESGVDALIAFLHEFAAERPAPD